MIICMHGMTEDGATEAVNLIEQLYTMYKIPVVVKNKQKWTVEQKRRPPGKMYLA